MPPRDEGERDSRRQQIMDGALRVFARKGFEKATNKEIAEAAGIGSAGLIYHYFTDKRDLFQSALEARLPTVHLLSHSDELMERPPREVLTLIAESFLQTLADPHFSPIFRLVLGEAMRRPHIAELLNQVGPLRGLAFLQRYLAQQMEQGTLRRADPAAAARCFIGPLLVYTLTREIFPQPNPESPTPDVMIETAIEIFLRGMER